MQDKPIESVMEELDELLDAERSALLAGDLEKISRLFERKSALIDRLARLEQREAKVLQALNHKVERNQVLLQEAAAGIRSVALRLASLRKVRTSLDTYDESGARKSVHLGTETSFEKRA